MSSLAETANPLIAEVTVRGCKVRIDFYGMVGRRVGSAMGPNKDGIIQTSGSVAETPEAAEEMAQRARGALELLGIAQRS